jgi:hypothetical protein
VTEAIHLNKQKTPATNKMGIAKGCGLVWGGDGWFKGGMFKEKGLFRRWASTALFAEQK